MKKVLIVFNHPAPYKVRLFNELSKKIDLSVIFERRKNKDRSNNYYFEKEYEFKEVKISGIKLGNENILSCGVKNHIKKNHYDLIVMNGYSTLAEMKAIRYMQHHNIPYALFINGGIIDANEPTWKKNLKKSFISKADFYLSPDEESNKYLIHYGANESKIFSYPNSTIYENEILKNELSEAEKEIIKKQFGITGEKVYVSAGQFIKRKNYKVLIYSWNDMPSNHHLYIFGDGKEEKSYRKIIKDLQLNNVHLHRFLPKQELLKVFSVSDVFLFPSSEDIYGHVINEALSQGLPVISNVNVNSARKLLSERTGLITSDFSAQNILASIRQIENQTTFKSCTDVAKENTVEIMSEKISKAILEK